MYQKFIKKIKKLFKIKFVFKLPKKKKILLYDEMHKLELREIIKQDFNVLKIRQIQIYFWIFIKQLIYLDFKFTTYCKNYIKYTSPKVVISFNDGKYRFYELKNFFKNVIFISMQLGVRDEANFKDLKLKSKNLYCDHFFVINKFYINEYKKIIKSKFHTLGRFTNNIVKVKKTKFKNGFLLISQFNAGEVKQSDHHLTKIYVKFLTCLNLYFRNSNKKLNILLRHKNPTLQKKEIEFHKKFFQFNFEFKKPSNWKKSYEILDQFENIIFMHSTLGYEAISRKKKVAIFPPKKIRNYDFWFGWPATFQKKYNFFSAKNLSNNEINRILNNIYNCSQSNWEKKHYSIIKDYLYLNKNNTKLRKLIFNLL